MDAAPSRKKNALWAQHSVNERVIESSYEFENFPLALAPATLPPDSLQTVDTIGTPYTLLGMTSVRSASTGRIERRPVSAK